MRLLPIVIGLTVVSASSLFAVHLQQTGLAHGGQYLPAAVCSSSLWAVYKQASLEASSPLFHYEQSGRIAFFIFSS